MPLGTGSHLRNNQNQTDVTCAQFCEQRGRSFSVDTMYKEFPVPSVFQRFGSLVAT